MFASELEFCVRSVFCTELHCHCDGAERHSLISNPGTVLSLPLRYAALHSVPFVVIGCNPFMARYVMDCKACTEM